MPVLSLISFFTAYSFVLFGLYILTLNRKEKLNKTAAIVNFCFAIWAFSDVFFYVSPTKEGAIFWHNLSAVGWILFCPFAAHFFMILSERIGRHNRFFWYITLYLFPAILLIKTFVTNKSPVAEDFVQSKIGWGWTYLTDAGSIWLWLYSLNILICFSFALAYTYQWAKRSKRLRLLKQAKSIILLDCIMIVTGFFSDIILPAVTPVIPPLFNILSIIWGVGFVLIIKNYKLMDVNDAATPDLIFKTIMDPILLLDSEGVIIKCNQATAALLKYEMDQITGRPLSDFYKNKQYGSSGLEKLFKDKMLKNTEIELLDSLGNIINTKAAFSLAESRLDGFIGVVVNLHDITEYKTLAASLENMANYDKLTKLPNRRLFFARLESAIENYKVTNERFAIAFIDLDGFKLINDSYGHDIGDQLLKKAADILLAVTRKQDTIARIGGDEFVLILANLYNEPELFKIIERIKEEFKEPIYIDDKYCSIGVSVGLSRCPEDGDTAAELMKTADQRMYQDKAAK